MQPNQGKAIYEIMRANNTKSALELGIFHGVSTCYMAGSLQDSGPGTRMAAIDLELARNKEPNVEHLPERAGLRDLVDVYYEPRSYNWRLMKFIEEGRRFDFCYFDGGHNWHDTGYAFFLVDKLLNTGGLALFDDLPWIAGNQEFAKHWPEEEKVVPAVRKVWDLLVGQHPSYKQLWVQGAWGLAQKVASS
jgi:predicted O-methyltransferase YrrM